MTSLSSSEITIAPARGLSSSPSEPKRSSRLLAGIYHDIGMAAVAIVLELPLDELEPDTHEAVRRGNRYIGLMPRREEARALQAAE